MTFMRHDELYAKWPKQLQWQILREREREREREDIKRERVGEEKTK